MWQALGCPLPLHRTQLALARLELRGRPAPADDITARVAEIEQACRLMGARGLAAEAAALRSSMNAATPEPAVSVRTLGGFRVLRGGVAVPHQAWQSRKARDLLKILVAHRGAPVARDQLCEHLWPQVDPARAGNRLSVAVSDSGLGIMDTLRPSLRSEFPRLAGLSDTDLLVEVFRQGVSRHGADRGCGLEISAVRCDHHALPGLEAERLGRGQVHARLGLVVARDFGAEDRIPAEIVAAREVGHQ